MSSSFLNEVVNGLITAFYEKILKRTPEQSEVSYWEEYIEQHGSNVEAVQSVLGHFLYSREYKMHLLNNLTSFESVINETVGKTKVAIWGTNEESRIIKTIIEHTSHSFCDITFFIDDNTKGKICGLPVKKIRKIDETIDFIIISKTVSEQDKIFEHDHLIRLSSKLRSFDSERYYLTLPNPIDGRIDSIKLCDLLSENVEIYAGGVTGDKFVQLMSELNNVYQSVFNQTINIDRIVGSTKSSLSTYKVAGPNVNHKILIAQDEHAKTVNMLLETGISIDNIHLIRYSNLKAKLSDLYFRDESILVYTKTKVGTSSFSNSFNHYGLPNLVTHYIIENPFIYMKEAYDTEYKGYSYRGNLLEYIKLNWYVLSNTVYINEYLKRNLHKKKMNVITGVRNPLDQMISFFFQCFDAEYSSGFRAYPDNLDILKEELKESVYTQFLYGDWFIHEFKKNLDVNVYDYFFDCSKGYQIIDSKNVCTLIIRVEDMDRVWNNAVTEWLGEERLKGIPVQLHKGNEASQKSIADIYKEVKSTIQFDAELIENIYSTQHAKHFYTDEELSQFKQYWLNR